MGIKNESYVCTSSAPGGSLHRHIWVKKNVELKLVKQGHFPSGLKHHTRPGKRLQFAIENGPVEIVDLPMKNGDFP